MPKERFYLFHSVSFLVCGTTNSTCSIRSALVPYVAQHWGKMQVDTCDADGDVHISAQSFTSDMMKAGSVSEFTAAGQIYPFTFEVNENVIVRGSCGDARKKVFKFYIIFFSPFDPITLNSIC